MKEFLTIADVCELLKLKKSFLYSLVESGAIPHYRIGRLIRFTHSDIENWIESHRKEGLGTCMAAGKARRGTPRHSGYSETSIDRLIERAIAEVKGVRYNSSHGKPDRIKGLGKEVSDGPL